MFILANMENFNAACREWTSCKRRCGLQRGRSGAWQWQRGQYPFRKEIRWQWKQYFLSFFQVRHIIPSRTWESATIYNFAIEEIHFVVKASLWCSFSFPTAGHCLPKQTAPHLPWAEMYGEIACGFILDMNTAQLWTAGLTSPCIWLQVCQDVWYDSCLFPASCLGKSVVSQCCILVIRPCWGF